MITGSHYRWPWAANGYSHDKRPGGKHRLSSLVGRLSRYLRQSAHTTPRPWLMRD